MKTEFNIVKDLLENEAFIEKLAKELSTNKIFIEKLNENLNNITDDNYCLHELKSLFGCVEAKIDVSGYHLLRNKFKLIIHNNIDEFVNLNLDLLTDVELNHLCNMLRICIASGNIIDDSNEFIRLYKFFSLVCRYNDIRKVYKQNAKNIEYTN